MKNIVVLQKEEDGKIYCREISPKGIQYIEAVPEYLGFWDKGGTILLEELEEILDKEI